MSQKTILVVEDEYGTAEVLQLMLEVEGYRVMLAGNGHEAMQRIAQHLPDLVLTDFMMPGMSGAQLGVALRTSPATAAVPIVMMSAAEEEEVRRAFTGYDAFLHKPYRIDELLEVLRSALARGAQARRQGRGDGPVMRSIAEALAGLLGRPRAPG
ncbi:MAG TPA: response regulator [Methylibium sp.]|uniref:response regulator n=1 Tax=Methylibium sp. TaxID=2067992 RepID=UPI002DBBB165|nr:response regulator [Methylibium sp.]HEU4460899.1 response regulator [Methylibium sp.]